MEVPSMEHNGTPETMPSFLKDEIAPILAAAERAAAQIIDRAREQARHDTESLERSRKEVETRITELVAWQEHVEPSIRSLQSKVADIQSKIEELPELIRKALDPVATAISSLDPTLAEVATAARPVLSMERLDAELPTGAEGVEG
jgi:predicted  nucleic acid-binding Zn-ribbon protein